LNKQQINESMRFPSGGIHDDPTDILQARTHFPSCGSCPVNDFDFSFYSLFIIRYYFRFLFTISLSYYRDASPGVYSLQSFIIHISGRLSSGFHFWLLLSVRFGLRPALLFGARERSLREGEGKTFD